MNLPELTSIETKASVCSMTICPPDINLTLKAFGEIRKKLEKGIYKKMSSKMQVS